MVAFKHASTGCDIPYEIVDFCIAQRPPSSHSAGTVSNSTPLGYGFRSVRQVLGSLNRSIRNDLNILQIGVLSTIDHC